MARIWYSICGEGMGHAIRSDSVIQDLIKKHKVLITAADKAYPFFRKKYGKRVIKIKGLVFIYKNNEIKIVASFANFLFNLPFLIYKNHKILRQVIKKFKPDLLITDFESTSNYIAKEHKIPSISVDNIHSLTDCKHEYKLPIFWKPVIRILHPKTKYHFVSAFTPLKPIGKNVHIVSPILRNKILKLKPKKGKHVLVYQTSSTNYKMLPILKKFKTEFRIYGMNKKGKQNNLIFKKFNEDGFIEDLRTCRYVIINGGFTVLSEALYFKKPVFAIPIIKQHEQLFNAHLIHKYKYGSYTENLKYKQLLKFENKIDSYSKNLSKIKKWNKSKLLKHIENILYRIQNHKVFKA